MSSKSSLKSDKGLVKDRHKMQVMQEYLKTKPSTVMKVGHKRMSSDSARAPEMFTRVKKSPLQFTRVESISARRVSTLSAKN